MFDKIPKKQNSETVKKLPIGIQTFSEIITGNYYYVDKTNIITDLYKEGKYYFLSRPRRFGKSLFLDTLKEAFEGNKALFAGLYLENNWDWNTKYPVIRFDFGNGVLKEQSILEQKIFEITNYHREINGIENFTNQTLSGKIEELIRNLNKKYSQKVVILVDEYDKPILDNITDKELAKQMRDGLRNLYSVFKGMDAHIKFVFITGVSKFSKINLFSGLNNLKDITLDNRYASICGYTEKELSYFEERLIDVNRDELKLWYNGYNFLGDSVYNPFDILLFLDSKNYKNYWFETGNPSFLIDLIKENQYSPLNLETVKLMDFHLSSFDIDSITLENLLFQTGYLTISHTERLGANTVYYLKYPNQEVKSSLTDVILHFLTNTITPNQDNKIKLFDSLKKGNLDNLQKIFHAFFASIPHDWYRKNTLANYEGYYASIFYCYFTALGFDVRVEDVTNHGQVDMTVFFEEKVYVFEFKVLELTDANSALAQIKERKYYEKYLTSINKEIYLVGVTFSRDNRNITNCEWEKL